MTAEDAYLALDVGNSRLKAAAVTAGGTRLQAYEADVSGILDAEELRTHVERALGELADRCVRGLCIASRMADLVLLDASMRPIAPILSGIRPGPAGAVEELVRRLAGRGIDLHQRTGCPLDSHYPGPKVMAWADAGNGSGWRHVAYAGDLKAFLLFWLTGRWLTDPACAAATQMFDQRRWQWLDVPGAALPRGALPSLAPPWELAGTLGPEAARRVGLPAGLPVAVGTGDGPAMSVAEGVLLGTEALVTLGTTAAVRWAETGMRPLGPSEFRQPLSRARRLRGRRLVGVAREDAMTCLGEAVRREADVTMVRLAGGVTSDLAAAVPDLPVRPARCHDATLGATVLAHLAVHGKGVPSTKERK